MLGFHNRLDLVQAFPLVYEQVIKKFLLAMPSAEVFRTFRRLDGGWDI